MTAGQKVTAVILHADTLSTCVHVSILPKLVGKKKSVSVAYRYRFVSAGIFLRCITCYPFLTIVSFSQLTEGSRYTSMVQYIDKDFAIISLDDTAQLAVIQTSSHLNEVILSESEKLRAGMTLEVEVVETSCEELQGLPLVSWERGAPRRQRTTSENLTNSRGHRFGEILQGKVRTVKPTCIQVTLEDGSTGSVHVSEVAEAAEVQLGSFPTSSVKAGSTVTARVIGGREASSHR